MHYARYQPLKQRAPGAGAFSDYVEDVRRRAAPMLRSCRIDRRSRYVAPGPLGAARVPELVPES